MLEELKFNLLIDFFLVSSFNIANEKRDAKMIIMHPECNLQI